MTCKDLGMNCGKAKWDNQADCADIEQQWTPYASLGYLLNKPSDTIVSEHKTVLTCRQ